MQNFESFARQLTGRPELYDNYKTFYIGMRNANFETRTAYNTIKNALMSYAAKINKGNTVIAELGQLFVNLKVDPRTQSTRKAMFKVVGNHMIRYKLEKETVVEQVIETIPRIMANEEFSSFESEFEDYASFFARDIDDKEAAEVIADSQKEYEENVITEANSALDKNLEESTSDVGNNDTNYDDYYDEKEYIRDYRTFQRQVARR